MATAILICGCLCKINGLSLAMAERSSGHGSQGSKSIYPSRGERSPPFDEEEKKMQSCKYARQVPAILAEMEQERERDDKQPDQGEQVPEKVVYIYPLEGGGVVFTETPIDEDEPAAPTVVSAGPETDQRPIT